MNTTKPSKKITERQAYGIEVLNTIDSLRNMGETLGERKIE